jgi:uncharacterized SAM-dependent methyltransferase
MYLVSLRQQVVEIPSIGMRVPFREGERIHTENSYKFTRESVATILELAGFQLEQTWADRLECFAVHLARVNHGQTQSSARSGRITKLIR